MEYVNLEDYHTKAKGNLEASAYDYYASGAHDEGALHRNRQAFEAVRLYYRVLVDVSQRSMETSLLGRTLSMPLVVAPTAFHCLADPQGEVATARGAARAGTVMTLSTLSNRPMEEVGAEAKAGFWFQLYCYRDRMATEALIHRAEAAGAEAIVLTVDAPLLGTRWADVRNSFRLPSGLGVVNMMAQGMADLPDRPGKHSGLASYFQDLIDSSLNWKDLAWLRSVTKLPLILKGIVRVDDARRAVEAGVDGLVVSNHGGRQLESSPSTLEVLPRIAAVVPSDFPILLDGGIRSGTDVLKALAAGAQAVMLGRPILWGLAAEGEDGVLGVLELLRRELDLAMALCGCADLSQIGPWLFSPEH